MPFSFPFSVDLDSALSDCTLFLFCNPHLLLCLLSRLSLPISISNFVFPVFAETHPSRSWSSPAPLWVPSSQPAGGLPHRSICPRVDSNRPPWVGGRSGWHDCATLGEEFPRIKASGVRRELGKSVISTVDVGTVSGLPSLPCPTFQMRRLRHRRGVTVSHTASHDQALSAPGWGRGVWTRGKGRAACRCGHADLAPADPRGPCLESSCEGHQRQTGLVGGPGAGGPPGLPACGRAWP